MTTLYSILNADAKRWWYFRQLHDQGQITEARQKERESIKRHVESWRQVIADGGYLLIGAYGASLYYKNTSISGIDPVSYTAIARKLNVCIIDTRNLCVADILKTLKFPLINFERFDEPPYSSLSYAPLAYVAQLYKDIGAIVENI